MHLHCGYSSSIVGKFALGEKLENALVQYCLEMEKRLFGLTTLYKDVKHMTFKLAEENCLEHPFGKKFKSAGGSGCIPFCTDNPVF